MFVTLQVVGVYFKQDFKIPPSLGELISVKQVLDYAAQNSRPRTNFFYSTGEGDRKAEIEYMGARYEDKFKSPISGREYFPGTFSLVAEFRPLGTGDYRYWQFDVHDKNGAVVALPQGPQTHYDQANVVKDGYTVIFRLVEVCNAVPTKIPT